MQQQVVAASGRDRRKHRRIPASFAFWFRRPRSREPVAAFMLNMSTGGAAFVAAAETIPAVGERIELAEMHSSDRSLREQTPALPRIAEVLRVDDPSSQVRRVAVRFEVPVAARRGLRVSGAHNAKRRIQNAGRKRLNVAERTPRDGHWRERTDAVHAGMSPAESF